MRRTTLLTTLLLALIFGQRVSTRCCADTVTYATGKDGQGRSVVNGTVMDFTGEYLLFRASGGGQTKIPADRVLDVETDWPADYLEAERQSRNANFEKAVELYLQSLKAEKRGWAQRSIVARIIRGYQNLGRTQLAAEAFQHLLRSDPSTPYFHVIPLAWRPQQPSRSLEQAAREWMSHEQPAMRLLGASWLLSTSLRSQAIPVLQQLATDLDRRVATLAASQLWRTEIVTATEEQVSRWQAAIENMPADLRSGAYFVVGQALARHQQHDAAAVHLMRLPILFADDRPLSAAALLAAGRELEKAGHADEAQNLYREVVASFGETDSAAEAQARLKQ